MAFALNTSGVPSIRDHAHAAQVYEKLNTFPLRHARFGRDDGEKPGRPLNDAARNLGHNDRWRKARREFGEFV